MEFIRVHVETPAYRRTPRGLQPYYRLTNGYIQKTGPNTTLHPAVTRQEACRLSRAAGEQMVVIEEADPRDAITLEKSK